MVQIYFLTDVGTDALRTPEFRGLGNWHAWQDGSGMGTNTHFGVAHPSPNVDPNQVVDYLESVGMTVLPSVHDKDTDPHPKVVAALAKYGVKAGHKSHDVAKAIHAASGMPPLKPHLF